MIELRAATRTACMYASGMYVRKCWKLSTTDLNWDIIII